MSTKLNVDLDLLETYDITGPRYTSYPPATKFDDSFGPNEFRGALQGLSTGPTEPVSLYLHIPFCPKLCYFCGCHTVITRKRDRIARYLDHLFREIDVVSEWN